MSKKGENSTRMLWTEPVLRVEAEAKGVSTRCMSGVDQRGPVKIHSVSLIDESSRHSSEPVSANNAFHMPVFKVYRWQRRSLTSDTLVPSQTPPETKSGER